MASRSETLPLIADSERDANMLYAVGMFVADPFVYLRIDNRPYVLLSDLEFDRARKKAPHCRVLSLSRYQDRLRRDVVRTVSLARVVREVLREKKLKKVLVPANFPRGPAAPGCTRSYSYSSPPGLEATGCSKSQTLQPRAFEAVIQITACGSPLRW